MAMKVRQEDVVAQSDEELLRFWAEHMGDDAGAQVRQEILRRMKRVEVTDGPLQELLQVAADRGAAMTDTGHETFYKIFANGQPVSGTKHHPVLQQTGGKVWHRLKDIHRSRLNQIRVLYGEPKIVRYIGVPVEIVGRRTGD